MLSAKFSLPWRRYIFILGGGLMQERLIQECLSMEYSPVVLDQHQNIIANRYDCIILQVDISNPTDCVEICISFSKKIGVPPSAAMTVGTDFPVSVSAICQIFGLHGVSPLAAKNTSNKIRMRMILQENDISQPNFIPIENGANFQKLIAKIQFPLVIKPADSMGSRGVCKVDSPEELDASFFAAIQFSRTQQVLAESLITGPEFSLDALIFDGKVHITGFADRIIEHDPYFVEIGHNIPSRAPQKIQQEVEKIFVHAIQALGISYGFAKGDIFWDIHKKQAVVGEIASRLSGGFMSSYTYPQSSGVNLMKNALFLALGKSASIDLHPTRNWVCLERAILATTFGTISDIIHLEKTRSIDGITHIFFHKQLGDSVRPPRNNVEKIANILSCAPDYECAEKVMQTAFNTLQVIVKENVF